MAMIIKVILFLRDSDFFTKVCLVRTNPRPLQTNATKSVL